MTVTGIISALIIGLIIGALARLVLPGKQSIPIWLTILIGIVGAILGTLLAQNLGVAVTPGIDWIEIALQIAIAAVGVAIVSSFYGRRSLNR
jgi:uncharacterized membrane protein YeaQ/YmgE (transglycosylase-associated protein family)